MSIVVESQAGKHIIKIQGVFDYSLQEPFRQAYEQESNHASFIIDFSEVESIDVSVLTMLLSLREYAGGEQASIELTECSPKIRSILEVSKFHELFTVK